MGLMGSILVRELDLYKSHFHLYFKTLDKKSLENIIIPGNFQISFLPKLFFIIDFNFPTMIPKVKKKSSRAILADGKKQMLIDSFKVAWWDKMKKESNN